MVITDHSRNNIKGGFLMRQIGEIIVSNDTSVKVLKSEIIKLKFSSRSFDFNVRRISIKSIELFLMLTN